MTPQERQTVLCAVDDDALMELIRATLAVSIPSLVVERSTEASAARIPGAGCVIIASAAGTRRAMDMLRAVRAAGTEEPIIVMSASHDDETRTTMHQYGAAAVSTARVLQELPAVVATALASSGLAAHEHMAEVMRARRLIAAGELALDLQHSINNPLTALLAECQLLEMEPLSADHQDSVRRIVALCRRTIEVVRRLDSIAPDRPIQRHDPSTTGGQP